MAERTESSITVSAAPDAVLSVLADVEAYPEWNPEVRSVEVLSTSPADGRPERVRFVLDASPIKDTYVLAYTWGPGRRLSWTLVHSELLAALDGAYLLAEEAGGTTRVTYQLSVELKVPMISMVKRKGERIVVDRALRGLKQRVES